MLFSFSSRSKARSLLKSFVLAVSISQLFPPLAKASDLKAIADDLMAMIFSQLAEKDYRDYYNLQQTNKRLRISGIYLLALARLDNTKTLKLKDHSTVLVDEAIDLHKIKDIASFNSPEAFAYFLAKAAIASFKDLWQEETFLAAEQSREPNYLPFLSQTKGNILSSLMTKKRERLHTKQELSKLAYSLLFSMVGVELVASELAKSATITNIAINAFDIAEKAAWTAARDTAMNVALDIADADILDASEHAARVAASEVATNAQEEISSSGLTELQAIGKLSYRVAEKASLLYFLKYANSILEASLQAAYDRLPTNIDEQENIFSSEENWDAFKAAKFHHLSPNAREFLNPWLAELDKLVATIVRLNILIH